MDEFRPSRASSSRTRACRTAFSARRAAFSRRSVATCSRSGAGSEAGLVAHSSGASGRVVSIMPRLYRVAVHGASPPLRLLKVGERLHGGIKHHTDSAADGEHFG